MKFKRNILSLAVYSAVLGLTGCGVTSQDNGTGDTGASAVSGVAVDGYVARAVVFVDTNKNNKLDVWENRALTDSKGYFTYNPIDAVNYCELAKDHDDYTYCLKIPAGYDEVMVRITKGLDLTTLDPFTGTLSMMVSSNASSIENVIVGTPITGLMAEMTTQQKTDFFATETGLDVDLAKLDFLDFDTVDLMTGAQRLELLKLALKIHKVADSVAGVLDVAFAQAGDTNLFGVKEGIPTDASVYVYRAMAEKITDAQSISAALADQTLMEGIVSQAFAKMSAVVNDYNIANASSAYDIPASPNSTAIATNSLRIVAVVDSVFSNVLQAGDYVDVASQSHTYTASEDGKSRMRAVDIVASLIRSGAAEEAIANAEDLAKNNVLYLNYLTSSKADVTGIKTKFKAAGTIDEEGANYGSRQSFSDLFSDNTAGLTGTNNDGFSGNTLAIGEGGDSVGVNFLANDADPSATSGTMTIDASFADGAFAKEDADGNTEALALEGTWEQIDEYTMLMNIEVAGVIEPVIVKPTVTQDADGNDVTAYYFDLGGEQKIWIP